LTIAGSGYQFVSLSERGGERLLDENIDAGIH
jgi:hypothetical protein